MREWKGEPTFAKATVDKKGEGQKSEEEWDIRKKKVNKLLMYRAMNDSAANWHSPPAGGEYIIAKQENNGRSSMNK